MQGVPSCCCWGLERVHDGSPNVCTLESSTLLPVGAFKFKPTLSTDFIVTFFDFLRHLNLLKEVYKSKANLVSTSLRVCYPYFTVVEGVATMT